jgi:hypothetical protein
VQFDLRGTTRARHHRQQRPGPRGRRQQFGPGPVDEREHVRRREAGERRRQHRGRQQFGLGDHQQVVPRRAPGESLRRRRDRGDVDRSRAAAFAQVRLPELGAESRTSSSVAAAVWCTAASTRSSRSPSSSPPRRRGRRGAGTPPGAAGGGSGHAGNRSSAAAAVLRGRRTVPDRAEEAPQAGAQRQGPRKLPSASGTRVGGGTASGGQARTHNAPATRSRIVVMLPWGPLAPIGCTIVPTISAAGGTGHPRRPRVASAVARIDAPRAHASSRVQACAPFVAWGRAARSVSRGPCPRRTPCASFPSSH